MLTVLNIKSVIFRYFSTWQAGSVRNGFPNRRLHVGLPKPFFTLRVSYAFLRNAYLPYVTFPEYEKARSQAPAKEMSDSGFLMLFFLTLALLRIFLFRLIKGLYIHFCNQELLGVFLNFPILRGCRFLFCQQLRILRVRSFTFGIFLTPNSSKACSTAL